MLTSITQVSNVAEGFGKDDEDNEYVSALATIVTPSKKHHASEEEFQQDDNINYRKMNSKFPYFSCLHKDPDAEAKSLVLPGSKSIVQEMVDLNSSVAD